MPSFVPRSLAVLALAALPALAGCKEDPISPEQRVLGEWSLKTMDGGDPLPYFIVDTPALELEVLGSTLELRGDASCQEKTTYRSTTSSGTETSTTDLSCTWEIVGGAAVLTFPSKTATATRVGDGLVVLETGDDVAWEYGR